MVSAVKACNVFYHFHHQTSPSTSSRIFDVTNFSIFSSKKRESRLNLYTVLASAGERRNLSTTDAPVVALRRILNASRIYLGPACFDALSAKLIERAGFDFCFTTGFGVSAARLGLPNTGYLSYGEMIDQGLQITEAVSIPVIGDGNNGFGNAMNIKRTIKGYIKAGFAGIILEDQEGNQEEKKVLSREEAVLRIKAAVDSRKESGLDIVIVARTDSRQAISLEESLWRSRAFADAGADVIFIDSLASKEEMKAFCEISPLVPKMAMMYEGGGKLPLLSPFELEEIGFKIVAYPLSLLGVSIRAMQDALMGIKGGRIPPPGSMPTFEELKETLGFNAYYQEEKRYDMNLQKKTQEDPVIEVITPEVYDSYGADMNLQRTTQDPVVEVITPEVYDNYGADSSRESFSRVWSRKLRVKITGRDGSEKLDIRIPAGFLEGITNIVPALGGINIKALLDDASLEVGGKVLLDFNDSMGDRIQVFLE